MICCMVASSAKVAYKATEPISYRDDKGAELKSYV